MEKVKAWLYMPLLGLVNILSGYIITKSLDSLVGNKANSISELSVSSVHWLRYVPATLIAITVSILLFYVCKNLNGKTYTKILTYISSSLVMILVFVSGAWYKDPIYKVFLPEDDYYIAEKSNFISSNGAVLAWTEYCEQSGRLVYCYINFKNLSNKDQNIYIHVRDTRIVTGEKAHVNVQDYGKVGNQYEERIHKTRVVPKNMTISYGLKFELPEPSSFTMIPNLRLGVSVNGYKDVFSMSNKPLKNIIGH